MKNEDKRKGSRAKQDEGFLMKMDTFFHPRMNSIFLIALFVQIVFSLLLFQANISIGGDDSFYIMRAQNLLQDGTFPSFQGPLYPLFLTPLIAMFGINVLILKTFSIVLTSLFLFFFYRAFKDRINNSILVICLFVLALNAHVLYYASQTYNEAFHLFIQLLFFYQFFKVFQKVENSDAEFKTQYKDWILLGFTMFLMAISKNLGLVGIITVVGFFLIQGKWKSMIASIVPWLGFMGIFSVIKRVFFAAEAQISRQGLMLLYKDPYNFSKGKEDLVGFISRFIENSHIYLSKHLMKIFNLRDAGVTDKIELVTIFLSILMIYGLFKSYKKNKFIFFTGAYLLVTLSIVFVVLQTRWDADRLVFLVVPFFCVFVFYIFDDFLRRSRFKWSQAIFIMLTFLYLSSNVAASSKNIDLIGMKKKLAGEKYLGYTTDWVNFLRLSEWCGKNLPENSFVASRKAAMSSIYANGKKFYNISRVPSENADTLLDFFQENGVTHVIMANLRRNPKEKSEYTINTVRRYLYYIDQKYPGTFLVVHQEGQRNNEEAILFEINYNVRASRKNIP